MKVEQRKAATDSFLVGEVARHQEVMPRTKCRKL